jgi:hypothetical protein
MLAYNRKDAREQSSRTVDVFARELGNKKAQEIVHVLPEKARSPDASPGCRLQKIPSAASEAVPGENVA